MGNRPRTRVRVVIKRSREEEKSRSREEFETRVPMELVFYFSYSRLLLFLTSRLPIALLLYARMLKKFPPKFFWGAATSSHQTEGNTKNDWSEWETSEQRKFDLSQQGKNHDDFISGAACESFSRFDEDLDCLKQLGVNAYRFSVEWSRIEPVKGEINHAALDQYRSFIKKLRANNIEPFVTLWHWPVPLWVRDQGG